MRRMLELLRESFATARSAPVGSALTILVVASMMVAVMLTTGRTVGNEQQVLGSIDSVGTRTILFRADADAGVTTQALNRIASLDGIEWVGGFSGVLDATNARVPDGTRVPTRFVYSNDLTHAGISSSSQEDLAFASSTALQQLGLPDTAGSITQVDGETFGVGGELITPDFLTSFEPLVLIPRSTDNQDPINLVLIIAAAPELVSPVAEAATPLVGATDSSKVTIQTSERFADLRAIVQGQLGTFSRGLVAALLSVAAFLVSIILYGLVSMRRKDFGRRRALGATRLLIISLLLMQTCLQAIVGVGIGTAASVLVLALSGDPLPSAEFFVAVGVLGLATATLSALMPAIIASRREPIEELRVP